MRTTTAALVAAMISSVLVTSTARASPEIEVSLSPSASTVLRGGLGTSARIGVGDRVVVQTGIAATFAGMNGLGAEPLRGSAVSVPLEVVGEITERAPSTFVPTLRLAIAVTWQRESALGLASSEVLGGSCGAYAGLRYYVSSNVAIGAELGVVYAMLLDASGPVLGGLPHDSLATDVRISLVLHP